MSSFVETKKNVPKGRPLSLKSWLQVTYPLLIAASLDTFCLAAKFHYIKTVSGKVVAQSIDFRVVSIYWQGRRPLPPEILPPRDLPSPVNGILWEMSELITQERIAVGSSNLVEGLTT